MTRDGYLQRFRRYLGPLSKEEKDDAVAYVEEYFMEMGLDGQDPVPDELAPPRSMAYEIRRDLEVEKIPKEGLAKPWRLLSLVILGILALPVGLPLAIGLLALVLGLGVGAFGLILGLAGGALAGILTGFHGLISLPLFSGLWWVQLGTIFLALGLLVFLALLVGRLSQALVSYFRHRSQRRDPQ